MSKQNERERENECVCVCVCVCVCLCVCVCVCVCVQHNTWDVFSLPSTDPSQQQKHQCLKSSLRQGDGPAVEVVKTPPCHSGTLKQTKNATAQFSHNQHAKMQLSLLFFLSPSSGELRTQKLKSHLVRTQLKRSPFQARSRSVYSHTCYAESLKVGKAHKLHSNLLRV